MSRDEHRKAHALAQRTGLSVVDCAEALRANHWDAEAALEWLRRRMVIRG